VDTASVQPPLPLPLPTTPILNHTVHHFTCRQPFMGSEGESQGPPVLPADTPSFVCHPSPNGPLPAPSQNLHRCRKGGRLIRKRSKR
jgi:hypothetical protein